MTGLQKLPNHIARNIYSAELAKWKLTKPIQELAFDGVEAQRIAELTPAVLFESMGNNVGVLIPDYPYQPRPLVPNVYLLKPSDCLKTIGQLVGENRPFLLTLDTFGLQWGDDFSTLDADNNEIYRVDIMEYGNGPLALGKFGQTNRDS